MELALFTPGAYIWPVHRNFETFVASLGGPAVDAELLADSPLYPVVARREHHSGGLPQALGRRLVSLHRELYEALLRPVELYANEQQSFADFFWSDMRGSAPDALLEAFFYYFIRRSPAAVSVVTGLNTVRAVFFSHEAADPGLWLHRSLERVASVRANLTVRKIAFLAPANARLSATAFVMHSRRSRPVGGPGWCVGHASRLAAGECQLSAEYGLDLVSTGEALSEQALEQLDQEVRQGIAQVFGWREEIAA